MLGLWHLQRMLGVQLIGAGHNYAPTLGGLSLSHRAYQSIPVRIINCTVPYRLVKCEKTHQPAIMRSTSLLATRCTIQQSGGGGGCTAPLKYVCEKLKGGKKCCGCVVDKNAKPEVCQNYPLTTNFAAKIFSAQHPQCKTGASCSQTATALHCCCSTK